MVNLLKKVFCSRNSSYYEEIRKNEQELLNEAYDETELIAIENEKDPIFIDIYNKIMNKNFTNAKDTNYNGFYKSKKRFKVLIDGNIIYICSDISLGPGKEGLETGSGDYIDIYYMLFNGKEIGINGYITEKSFNSFINKINEFNNF
jgi:hypothetical protein